jgi:hypothetical protein
VRDAEVDWSEYGDHDQATTSLQGKDVIAIFIASLQTIFLPIVLLGVFMLIIGLIFGLLF